MNKVAAFALRRKNSILSMSEKRFCPPQPLRFWITPAYAGKRRSDWIIRSIYWGHPRVCEEKNFLLLMTSRRSGSPPRVRGKGHVCHCSLVCCRITPACAGKSLLRVVGQCYEPGITPARAGKRTSDAAGIAFWWDHPRVCGEKSSSSSRLSCASGSPPRMRGKESGCVPGLPGSRITPAHAGKRDKTAIFEEWCRDHPCVCGEKTKPVPAGGILMGSPPRVRGKAVAQGAHVLAAGITPAHAGKRTRPRRWVRPPRDHPRACGEKITDETIGVVIQGSPPRVRGKASLFHALGNNHRITPACAGKSVRRENSSS